MVRFQDYAPLPRTEVLVYLRPGAPLAMITELLDRFTDPDLIEYVVANHPTGAIIQCDTYELAAFILIAEREWVWKVQ